MKSDYGLKINVDGVNAELKSLPNLQEGKYVQEDSFLIPLHDISMVVIGTKVPLNKKAHYLELSGLNLFRERQYIELWPMNGGNRISLYSPLEDSIRRVNLSLRNFDYIPKHLDLGPGEIAKYFLNLNGPETPYLQFEVIKVP